MSYIDTVIRMAGVGNAIVHVSVLKRFLSVVVMVVALVAISSILAGAMIVAAFYGLYLSLMHYGIDQRIAVFSIAALALLIMGGLSLLAYIRWKQLHAMPDFEEIPIIGRVSSIADSFIDGYRGRRSHRP